MNCWLEDCVNCGRQTMVERTGDKCQFCGKNHSKKEVTMTEAATTTTEERRPVPPKPKKVSKLQDYWEHNKTDILADYQSMKIVDFYARWHMSTQTWIALKALWSVKNKRGNYTPRPPAVEEPRKAPAAPGGAALEAAMVLKNNEHEEYLTLKGYQMAVREFLAAGRV